jgi:hypothetical protein
MSGIFRSRTTICTGCMPSTSMARSPVPASAKFTSLKEPRAARTIRRIVGESSTTRIVCIRAYEARSRMSARDAGTEVERQLGRP